MALIDFKVLPGIDKQDTESGAENRWVDCDNVRFRYNLPEKVGGWSSLISDSIVGVARREFAFVDLDGNRYVAIGTDKFLLIYFEGQLYDITPIKSTIASVVMSAVDATKEVSLTFSSNHNLQAGDNLLIDTQAAQVTITLPASPAMGDEVSIMDVSPSGGFGTNKVTVNRNSQPIRGAASNLELTTNNQSIKLRYTNATKGWQYVYNQTS